MAGAGAKTIAGAIAKTIAGAGAGAGARAGAGAGAGGEATSADWSVLKQQSCARNHPIRRDRGGEARRGCCRRVAGIERWRHLELGGGQAGGDWV